MKEEQEPPDDELLRRAISRAIAKRKHGPAWHAVSIALGVNAKQAGRLCRRFCMDHNTGMPMEEELE